MSDHFVEIDLESTFPGDRPHLICKAPPEAMCHAVWDCPCEGWIHSGVEDGKPWHDPRDFSEPDRGNRHYGRFDSDECNLRDWAENSDECLRGEVVLPVTAEWHGDYVLFHAATEGDQP